jgi:hypothetical protein
MTPNARLCAAFVLMTAAASASAAPADVAGAWAMSYTTKDGVKMASTLTLKVEGDTVTGTISSPRGSVPLNEASVKGDDVAFAIERVGFGDHIRIEYTGKVKGDTMTLKMKVGARDPIDVTAKRGAAGPP